MATELSYISPGTLVVHQEHHDLESFFYILLAVCLLYDKPNKLKPPKVLSQCFNPLFTVTQPSTLKVVTIQSDFGWTALMLYIAPYFQPLFPLLEKIHKELILPIRLQNGVIQANHSFTHNLFIDAIVMVLAKLLESHWVPKGSGTWKAPILQTSTTLSASSIPGANRFSSILPSGPLPRLPLIRMPGASSTNSKRCHENEDESGSRLPKRRSPAVGATDASCSGNVDVLSPTGSASSTPWTNIST